MLVGRFIPGTKLLPLKLLSFYARAFYGSWAGHKLRNEAVHGGGTQSESAAQKTRKKHEPGHMPVAAPAMLEGYASTRPPRTEQ